jgi:hypothetical protein
VLDALDYWLTQARLWMVDTAHGPEPETMTDEMREIERERLRRAFPQIDVECTIVVGRRGHETAVSQRRSVMAKRFGGRLSIRWFE